MKRMLPENRIRKVKALMILKGVTPSDVAAVRGISPKTVTIVVNGFGKSKPVYQDLAEVLGLPYERLWGKRAA